VGLGEVVFPCHLPGSALSKHSAAFVYTSIKIIQLLCPTVCATLYFMLLLFTLIQTLGVNIAFIRA
jgi:hypothetical protein